MKHTSRWLGAVAAAGLIGTALAGCAGSPTTTTATTSGAKGTLTISVWDYAQTPEFNALFTAFEKANPGVTIDPVDVPNASDYEAKVTTMLSGGNAPDIITVKNLTDYSGYVAKNELENLNSVEKSLSAEQIHGLSSYQFKNNFYAIPYRTDFSVLFYNKTMFKEAGLADPSNLTWSEFASDAAKLTHGTGATKVYGAYIPTWNSLVQGIAAAQNDKDLNKPPYGYLKDQYNMVLGLQKAGDIINYSDATTQQTSYQTVFETGQAAMVPMGTWLIADLLASKNAGKINIDWGIAPLPQIDSGKPIVTDGGPTGFAIPQGTKDSALAKRFIAFAASAQGARAVASIGIVPAYQTDSIRNDYFSLKGMPTDALSKKAFVPDIIRPDLPVNPNASAVNTILGQEHQLIMTGSVSVDSGLATMAQRVQSEVLDQ